VTQKLVNLKSMLAEAQRILHGVHQNLYPAQDLDHTDLVDQQDPTADLVQDLVPIAGVLDLEIDIAEMEETDMLVDLGLDPDQEAMAEDLQEDTVDLPCRPENAT